MIPARREIPGREKFEAIQEGGNGNFPLNIPGRVVLVMGRVLPATLGGYALQSIS